MVIYCRKKYLEFKEALEDEQNRKSKMEKEQLDNFEDSMLKSERSSGKVDKKRGSKQ